MTNYHLDLQDELSRHLTQAQAIIDYLTVDISMNKEFSVSNEIVTNTLWTAQTLLKNANQTYSKLSEAIRKGENDEKA
ncbi:hypothetical protein [Rodentibacter caecimuris]|uniref:Uncharacterized protein n=1 Tax=Rodentibacter caecimuris TaxID=1796644 RepID=A0ABX3KWM1_9PAST|nr:hypothetical protein BKG89_09320 [Rodentibacter heylii]